MASVTLKGITKRWNEFVAVRDLSLLIEDQEFLVLLGPSGCGKTTTMRMIAGLEEPTLGDVFIGERKVNDDLPKDRDIAMVFQNYGLYPHLSVYENIRYPLKVRKVPKSLHSEKVRQAAEKVQLDHLLERKPRELSGGQRQRVALARAIVRTPTVFLMDEPLSNLDAKLRVTMRAELKHLQHELKITTVYVTHDQIEAMTLADRVAVMDHGIISQLGPPEEIYNDPANLFVAGFIGSPPMNLMKGKLHDNNFQHPNFSISINHEANLEEATLGIRPEDLILCAAQKGVLQGTVYAHELTGESTLTTINVGPDRLTIRGPKEFKINIDEAVGVQFEASKCFLFSNQTGERI
ncbi:MAG: ABC transporter ATP-binding protein [Proteobacteria bacterium]|nr:ABC transporter ATP-binding protein [Pseudomonadota bacterium]